MSTTVIYEKIQKLKLEMILDGWMAGISRKNIPMMVGRAILDIPYGQNGRIGMRNMRV